ncbi:hypothetical protein J5X84_36330 [Streptosporangiaceae bacterium NEAU-GS5]|nr:hypothetical protein [Streptosporangiaceae bacterium NEAU-GS5]
MTPQELHAAIDAVRREERLVWWQVAVQADTGEAPLRALKRGSMTAYQPGLVWLERHTNPSRE